MISFSFVSVCWCIAGDPHASPSHRQHTMCHRQARCSESSAASLVIKALKEPEPDRQKKLGRFGKHVSLLNMHAPLMEMIRMIFSRIFKKLEKLQEQKLIEKLFQPEEMKIWSL
ncbi:hypothetical protein YC2023_028503 [Brassica napus]